MPLFKVFDFFSQNESLTQELLDDVQSNTYKFVEMRVSRSCIPLMSKRNMLLLTKDAEKQYKHWHTQQTIDLTVSERKFLTEQTRLMVGAEWKENNFEKFKLINEDEVASYMKRNDGNNYLGVSKPIFFRNNEIALMYFVNLCCGYVGGGYYFYGFYKKIDGHWKEWIPIQSGNY